MVEIGISEIAGLIQGTNNFYLMIAILTWTIVVVVVVFMVFLSKRDFQNVMHKFGRIEEATDNLKTRVPGIQSKVDKVSEKLIYFGNTVSNLAKKVKVIDKKTANFAGPSAEEIMQPLSVFQARLSKIEMEMERMKNQIPAMVGQKVRIVKKAERNFKKNVGRRVHGVVLLYLKQILNNLRYEKDRESLGLHFRNLETFIEFAQERGYWDDQMMETIVKYLDNVKKEWESTPEVASVFATEIDRVGKFKKKKKKVY